MDVSCMRHASGHNYSKVYFDYRNSSFIVDVAMVQIPRSTERISSCMMSFIKICPRIREI